MALRSVLRVPVLPFMDCQATIPIGVEFSDPAKMPDMLSATQWSTATDLKNMKFYYRTQYNSAIRCIDVAAIDFGKVKYQEAPLDHSRMQLVEYIQVK